MLCMRCGNLNQENARFCSNCGIPSGIYAQVQAPALQPYPPMVGYHQMALPVLPQKKASKKKWIIGIAGILALMAIAANKAENNQTRIITTEGLVAPGQDLTDDEINH